MMLFCFHSPCVQSPLKKKVEAFERHAVDALTPGVSGNQARTTRNTAKTALTESSAGRSMLKMPTTPKIGEIYRNVKPFTPVGQPTVPQSGYYSSQESINRIPSTSSSATSLTSKLAHLNRPASASKVSHMRDSAEEVKKGLQEQADEKKRKREEKLKQVQLMREAKEKEKLDKLKKQMQVREQHKLCSYFYFIYCQVNC